MKLEAEKIMDELNDLVFVRKAPKPTSMRQGKSPIEKAREKLIGEIDVQISLANDPAFVIRKTRNKRDGTTEEIVRAPRSWATVEGDDAYLTIRFSNKVMPLGGKRGSIIRCPVDQVAETLGTVRTYVAEGKADELLDRMAKESRRKPRKAVTEEDLSE